ncbi:type VI secretion system tube protein Hcp [bacterium]|nr:type VI secretion system tube protein Hcp [bacterium]
MIDAYLQIEGIPGESTAKGYEKQIEIVDFSHNVHQSTDISASSSGGATTGRTTHSDFTVTKQIDLASPVLAQRCCDGSHIPKIALTVLRAGGQGKQVPFLVVTLTNVVVSDVAYGGQKESLPTETVSFNYGKIEWVYTQQKRADGGGGGNTTGSWNLETNAAE